MEYLEEDKLALLLHKEWLVKSDNGKSASYLIKFYASTVDQSCYLMITDTKHVWGEVLTSKQIIRRWCDCNPGVASPLLLKEDEEDEWKSNMLELLTSAHSLGALPDLSFEIIDSRNADLAFELRSEEFKWRWETYSLGPKVSAEVISKHLIMPLISVTHMALSSAEAVSGLSDADLEKAVDKVGRTARRTVATHIKTAISKPRVATALKRMTAVFNFLPDMPSIISEMQPPVLKLPVVKPKSPAPSQAPQNARSPSAGPSRISSAYVANKSAKEAIDSSATEHSEDDQDAPATASKSAANGTLLHHTNQALSRSGSAEAHQRPSTSKEHEPSSGTSSPTRPSKKARKTPDSDDSDSDDESARRRKLALSKRPANSSLKQPPKRTGRRF